MWWFRVYITNSEAWVHFLYLTSRLVPLGRRPENSSLQKTSTERKDSIILIFVDFTMKFLQCSILFWNREVNTKSTSFKYRKWVPDGEQDLGMEKMEQRTYWFYFSLAIIFENPTFILFINIVIWLKRKLTPLVTLNVCRTVSHYLLGTSHKIFYNLGIAHGFWSHYNHSPEYQVKNYSLLFHPCVLAPVVFSLECPFLTLCLVNYLSFRKQQLKYFLLSLPFTDPTGIINWFIIYVLSALLTHLRHST